MGLFGKKTDWSHMSEDDMKKNIQNTSIEDRFCLTLYQENFVDLKQLVSSDDFKEEKIIETTIPSQLGDLIIPSLYVIDNKFLACSRDMAIHGLMLTIISFEGKIAICLETYDNPFISKYDPTKNTFYPFLLINRKDIHSFESQDHQKFKAVKAKKSQQFAKNLGAGFWGAAGGFIPSLVVRGIFSAVGKAEDETEEKIGSIFTLKYYINESIKEIDIACETHYADLFERFLTTHFTTNIPVLEPEPTTREERRKREAEMLKVGDKVKFPGWVIKYGHIVKKEPDYAVIKLITKDGSEKFENVDYLKITRLRE